MRQGIDSRIIALSQFIKRTTDTLERGGRLNGDDVRNLRHAIGQVAVLRQTDWNDRGGVAWSDREDALLTGFARHLKPLLNRAARSVTSSNGQPYSGIELFAAKDDPQSVLWEFFQDDAEHAAEAPAPPAPPPAVKPDPVAVATKQAHKRRRRQTTPKGLTAKQLEAVEAFGQAECNYSKASRQLGLSLSATKDRIHSAYAKLGEKLPTKARTEALRTDRRGGVLVSADRRKD